MTIEALVSDQLTLTDAGRKWAVATEGRPLRRYFSVTTVECDADSTVRLAKLYKGERVMGGRIGADTPGDTNADLALGDGTTADLYLAAVAADAVIDAAFAHTPALGFGTIQAADGEIVATVSTAGFVADVVIAGYIDVMHP